MISSKLVYIIIFFGTFITMAAGDSFVAFEDWSESSIEFPTTTILPPFKFVIITDTKLGYCSKPKHCRILLNEIIYDERDKRNVSPRFPHFFIGGDGNAYEVQGWKSSASNNSFRCLNNNYIEITFVTSVKYLKLEPYQIRIAQKLLESGILQGKLLRSYKLFGEWQLFPNSGDMWSNENKELLKMWPHWSNLSHPCRLII